MVRLHDSTMLLAMATRDRSLAMSVLADGELRGVVPIKTARPSAYSWIRLSLSLAINPNCKDSHHGRRRRQQPHHRWHRQE
jgi:hypothetical protein